MTNPSKLFCKENRCPKCRNKFNRFETAKLKKNSYDLYLYSRSWRSSTGSRPCGFWIGVMRFCFCCIWKISEVCPEPCCCWDCWDWGSDCNVREVLGTAWAEMGAWTGAGEGLPLGAGTGSIWVPLGVSPPWPIIKDGVKETVTKRVEHLWPGILCW